VQFPLALYKKASPVLDCGLATGGGEMDAQSWIAAYAGRLGIAAPSEDEFQAILDLAAEAAHSSERVAAPVACWVAAKAGLPLNEALAAAQGIGTQS
jgi:Domain of unknown function (DUF6457)